MIKEFLKNISVHVDQQTRINDLEERLERLENLCVALMSASDESLECLLFVEQVLLRHKMIYKPEPEELN